MVAKSFFGSSFQVGDIALMYLPRAEFNGALKLYWARLLVALRVAGERCCLKDEGSSQNSKGAIHIRRLRHYSDRQM